MYMCICYECQLLAFVRRTVYTERCSSLGTFEALGEKREPGEVSQPYNTHVTLGSRQCSDFTERSNVYDR